MLHLCMYISGVDFREEFGGWGIPYHLAFIRNNMSLNKLFLSEINRD